MTQIPPKIRELVRKRSRGLCEVDRCGKQATEIHHKKLKSRLGSNNLNNLLAVCHICHDAITLNRKGTGRYRTHSWQQESQTEADE